MMPANKNSSIFNYQQKDERFKNIIKDDLRTQEDCVFLFKKLKRYSFYFDFNKKFPNLIPMDSLLYICKVCQYHKLDANERLFRKGDPIKNRVYIVVSGFVHLVEEKTQKLADIEREQKKERMARLKKKKSFTTIHELGESLTSLEQSVATHTIANSSKLNIS